jgi:hypothetical protein
MSGIDVGRIHVQRRLGLARRLLLPAVMQIERGERGMTVAETRIIAQALMNLLVRLVKPGRIVRVAESHHEQMREPVFDARLTEARIELQGAPQHLPGATEIEHPQTHEKFGLGKVPISFRVVRRSSRPRPTGARRFGRAATSR